jgi:tripartite-type tricarboxylate transporter receptor subunit TctC
MTLGRIAVLTLLQAGISAHAWAADYPTKPIRLIVPFAAGALTEIPARMVAQKASPRLGQQVVVDNRGGAEGRIGVEVLSKAPADGYTVGMGTIGTLAIAPEIYSKLNYDPAQSFAPISLMTTAPYLVVVHPAVPAHTLKEFIDYAKSKPGQLNFANANLFGRLVLEKFNGDAGVKIVHVPYQTAIAASTDLIAGRTQLMIEAPAAFRQEIQAGKLRALAVADGKRYAPLPNVPTTAEAGLAGFEARAWFGLLAPRGTPAQIIQRWNMETNHALSLPDVRESLANQGFVAAGTTPGQFAALIAEERVKWARVVKASGIKFD